MVQGRFGGSTVIRDPGSFSLSALPFQFMASILVTAAAPATASTFQTAGRRKVMFRKVTQNLEIKQKDGCVSYQCHRITLSSSPKGHLTWRMAL